MSIEINKKSIRHFLTYESRVEMADGRSFHCAPSSLDWELTDDQIKFLGNNPQVLQDFLDTLPICEEANK